MSAVPTRNIIPAGVVYASENETPNLHGLSLVFSGPCQYGDQVAADDVLYIDFDRKKVARDGLYLVEWMEGGRVTWMGCRRFAIVPTSTGSNIKVDWLADGRWEACDIESNGRLRLGDAELRVVGYVRDVYRSMGNGLVASTRAGSERASQANAEIHGKEVANHG